MLQSLVSLFTGSSASQSYTLENDILVHEVSLISEGGYAFVHKVKDPQGHLFALKKINCSVSAIHRLKPLGQCYPEDGSR